MVLRLKQGLQVAAQLVGGVPLFGDVQLLHIQPAGIHHNAVRPGAGGADRVVPVQFMPGGARPAVIACQGENAVLGDRFGIAAETFPLAGTFALVVPAAIAGTPLLPCGDREPGFFQAHTHRDPFLIGQVCRGDKVQGFLEIICIVHSVYHPKSKIGVVSAEGI